MAWEENGLQLTDEFLDHTTLNCRGLQILRSAAVKVAVTA
jgi:hypothetical protein